MKKSLKAVLGVALVITLLATSLLPVLGATLVNVNSTHVIGGVTSGREHAAGGSPGVYKGSYLTDDYQDAAYAWKYDMSTKITVLGDGARSYDWTYDGWYTGRYRLDGRGAVCSWADRHSQAYNETADVTRYFWQNWWPKARALYYFMPVWEGEYESFSDGTTTYYTSGYNTIRLTSKQQEQVKKILDACYNTSVKNGNNFYNNAVPKSTYGYWADVGYMAMEMAGISNPSKTDLYGLAHAMIDNYQNGAWIEADDDDDVVWTGHVNEKYKNAIKIIECVICESDKKAESPVPEVPAPVACYHCYFHRGSGDVDGWQTYASACFARVGIKVNKVVDDALKKDNVKKYYDPSNLKITFHRGPGCGSPLGDRTALTSDGYNINYMFSPLRADGKDAYGGTVYSTDPEFKFGSDLTETIWVTGDNYGNNGVTLYLQETGQNNATACFWDVGVVKSTSSSIFSVEDAAAHKVSFKFGDQFWGTVQTLDLKNYPKYGLVAIKKTAKDSPDDVTGEPLPGARYAFYRSYKGGTEFTGDKPENVENVYTGGTLSDKWGTITSGTDGYAVANPGLFGTYYIQEEKAVTYNGKTYSRDPKVYEVNLTPDKYMVTDQSVIDGIRNTTFTDKTENGKWVFPSTSFPSANAKTLVIQLSDTPTEQPEPMTLSLRKTTQEKDAFCDELSAYSLAGGEFDVYDDKAMTHKLTTLITDETGYAPEWTVADDHGTPISKMPGEYIDLYLKERIAPKGHQINEDFNAGKDDKNHVRIYGGGSGEVTCEDPVVRDPVELTKTDKDTGAPLAGAIYRLTWIDDDGYYENHMDELEQDAEAGIYIPGKNTPDDENDTINQPFENTRTWYYETDVNGYWINNNRDFLVSDGRYRSDDLFGEDGSDRNLPLGAYTIQEVEAPEGYYLSPDIFVGRISDETKTYHVDATDIKSHKLAIKGNKIWNDYNNMDGIRPSEIYVQLYRDDEKFGEAVKLEVKDYGVITRFEFDDLEEGYMVQHNVYDDLTGELVEAKGTIHYYDYYIVELNGADTEMGEGAPEGYTPQYRSPLAVTTVNGKTVYNENVSQHPFMTSVGTYNEITGEVDWSEPVRAEGVYEGNVQIVNTHTPERVNLHVVKKWDDHDNAMNRRPGEISADISWKVEGQNAQVDRTITLKSSDNWEQTIEGLLKNYYGKVREWNLSETHVPGYDTPEISITKNPNAENDFYVVLKNPELVYPASVRKTDGAGNPLEGVTFELYCDSMPNSPVSYLKLNTETSKYEFVGFEAKDGASNVLTTDADGYINVADLPQGKWHFKETSTVSGKMIYDGDIDIEFTEDGQSLVSDGNGGTTEGNAVEVRNNNVIMPQTGGQGTAIFVALSLLCAAAAGVFILVAVRRRRMTSR